MKDEQSAPDHSPAEPAEPADGHDEAPPPSDDQTPTRAHEEPTKEPSSRPKPQMPASTRGFWGEWARRLPIPRPTGPIESLQMSAPRLLTRGVVLPGVVLLVGAVFYGPQLIETMTSVHTPDALKIAMVAAPILYLAYLAYRVLTHPSEPREVRFADEEFTLPRSPNSPRDTHVAYGDVQALLAVARGPTQSVIVDYGRGTAIFSSVDFARPDAPTLLRRELLRRIDDLPDADAVLERMRTQQERARRLSQRDNHATLAMLVIIGLAFVFQEFVGGLETTLGMVRWGAAAPSLIDEGQYFRLVAANLYHGGWLHLGLNGVALFFLGTVVEKLTDRWTLVFVTLLSGVLGVAASWLLTDPWPFSVGSSAAIFGLFGAYAVLHLTYGRELPAIYRQSITWWVVILGINGALSFGVEMVDEWAHTGGMIAGALAMWITLAGRRDIDEVRRPRRWVQALSALLVAAFAGGVVWTAVYAAQPRPEDHARVYEALVAQAERGQIEPLTVNNTAFMAAIEQDISAAELKWLERAVLAVLPDPDDQPQIADTLATIRYRRASLADDADAARSLYQAAIDGQIGVLAAAKDPEASDEVRQTLPIFTTQLARFLDAYHQRFQAWRRAGPAEAPRITRSAGELEVSWPQTPPRSVRVFALAHDDDALVGLVELCVRQSSASARFDTPDAMEEWPDDATFTAAYVDEPAACDTSLAAWSAVDEVLAYP